MKLSYNSIGVFALTVITCVSVVMFGNSQQVQVVLPVNNQAYSVEGERDHEKSSTLVNSEASPLHYSEAIGMQHDRSLKGNSTNADNAHYIDRAEAAVVNKEEDQLQIAVYLTDSDTVEQVPIEQYVLGVTLAELPGSFELEAIKAQMIAVRTYILHRLHTSVEHTEDYDVTDTTQHQVYSDTLEVKQYAAEHEEYYEKFLQALHETEGMVISYENKLIEALFFSTSNGYTEDAVAVWGNEVEYLQSVNSPWDKELSPSYENELSLSFNDVYEKLDIAENERNGKISMKRLVVNDSGRVDSLTINGASFTGKQLRDKLGLSSTDLKWTISEDERQITFTSYGYGHGVGMSQWGANGMAKQGKSAKQIIKHYYTDVEIEQASKLVKNY